MRSVKSLLKDLYIMPQITIYVGFAMWLLFCSLLFQFQFNIVYCFFVLVGVVAAVTLAFVQVLPQELGATWVKISLSRKHLLDIKHQGHAVPGLVIVGHFRNSTEFYNFCYAPLDQYLDVYVKVPVYHFAAMRFDHGWSGVFLWEVDTKNMIIDALRLQLNNEAPDPENRIDVMLAPTELKLIRSFPIEVNYTTIPSDYYGWKHSALRILFTVSAMYPATSIKQICTNLKIRLTKKIKG